MHINQTGFISNGLELSSNKRKSQHQILSHIMHLLVGNQ
ncbi:hypothetical protein BN1095_790048 [Clostridioides difficile]|uniref:Uncharacterized protein n=1 Tax=Clostridioides difficile TaxID=1496 RepID=A0A069AZC8_CLODI|nr:hypothetical protein BN1095_790048 [Clostridioides difficile]